MNALLAFLLNLKIAGQDLFFEMRLKVPPILFFCPTLTYEGEKSNEIGSQNESQIGAGSFSDFVEIKKGSFGYGIFAKELIKS